uniref:Uncharacterized protein n=1 Tax=Anguilla anguilla TaxID=7936 RepID=A0A0E9PSA8_ANGAN
MASEGCRFESQAGHCDVPLSRVHPELLQYLSIL